MSLSSEYSLLAATFFNNVNAGDWKIYAILAVTSTGTEVVITDRSGRQMVVLITDRKSLGASQILGADGSTLAVVTTTAPGIISTATAGLVVKLTGAQPVTLPASQTIQIVDPIVNTQKLRVDTNGNISVTPLHVAIDGANNAFTQTATGVATATQMITTGTLYKELRLKNIGSNPAFLGFDNTVSAVTGYELTALTGTSDEIIMYDFNANLWGFSTLGTTLSIEGRG